MHELKRPDLLLPKSLRQADFKETDFQVTFSFTLTLLQIEAPAVRSASSAKGTNGRRYLV